MDTIQSVDHNPMRAAHEAPRCQHIRLNGQRCAAPALRGQNHCHFHERIQPQVLYNEIREPFLPFVEDATSLQCALMRVMHLLTLDQIDHKRCALQLYALQIASSNLKNFIAEHPRQEDEQPQPKIVSTRKENNLSGKKNDEPRLAALLVGLAAKGVVSLNLDAPVSREFEDYHKAVEQARRPTPLPTASPGQETANEESGEGSGAPALPPEDGPVV